MSSVSSYDDSDKDLFHQRTLEGFMPRQSYLRKTDLMESNDNPRSSRDTDTWSMAAVDDQESVISTNTQKSRLIRDFASTPNHNSKVSLDLTRPSLDIASVETDTLISQLDARSTTTTRSLVAECDDDRTTDDFKSEFSSTNDDDNDTQTDNQQHSQHFSDNDREHHAYRHHHRHHRHHSSHSHIDDSIRAPTEPQPSIAIEGKTYTHLIEENELLHAQLRHLEVATKHQQNIISSMQSHHHRHAHDDLCGSELNSNILSKQLTTWAEQVTHFSKQWAATSTQQHQVEPELFHHVMEYYLHALPFGTENQVILNTAYQDQLTRFHNTLGPHFAKWYRRQTVQSLARNPATHGYLHAVRMLMTQDIGRVLDVDCALLTDSKEWQLLLDACARLSLELHSSEQDVLIRPLTPGSIYDGNIMVAIDDGVLDTMASDDTTTAAGLAKDHDVGRRIKSIVCPLFIDEQNTILLPARVILE